MVHSRPLIAIIDNDLVLAELLCLALGDEGYATAQWMRDQDPVAFIRTIRPGLVILDLRLDGGWQGMSIVRALRHDPLLASVPIIVCSADLPMLRENACCLKSLGVQVVEKPFDLEALLDLVAHTESAA
jgi:DNA-binding response OmpR family regulator